MPVVTALRARQGRVAVELDGAPWRTLPVAAALEAGLAVGLVLDREHARVLGRTLRRHRARDTAVRALARREHSRASLDARLDRAGIRPGDRSDVLETAARAGLLDDARFAASRARALVDRGAGDRVVLDDLARHGVDEETARAAVASVDPEPTRAAAIVSARGSSARTLRYLVSRGFSEESLETLVADLESGAVG
jgi:regulatory protein